MSLWFRYNFTIIDLDEHKQDERKVRRYFTGVISSVFVMYKYGKYCMLRCCFLSFRSKDRRHNSRFSSNTSIFFL